MERDRVAVHTSCEAHSHVHIRTRAIYAILTHPCTVPHGIFGIPLKDSIRYANVAISLFNEDGQSYIYGYVPIVVAKCGVYLKEKGEALCS